MAYSFCVAYALIIIRYYHCYYQYDIVIVTIIIITIIIITVLVIVIGIFVVIVIVVIVVIIIIIIIIITIIVIIISIIIIIITISQTFRFILLFGLLFRSKLFCNSTHYLVTLTNVYLSNVNFIGAKGSA